MGWCHITLSRDTRERLTRDNPKALADFDKMNADAERIIYGDRPNEEHREAEDRMTDHRGFNAH